MTTEAKRNLLTAVHEANDALGRVVDGGHDITRYTELTDRCIAAMAGLSVVAADLEAQIGTDNL
jgi:hypothetical protein